MMILNKEIYTTARKAAKDAVIEVWPERPSFDEVCDTSFAAAQEAVFDEFVEDGLTAENAREKVNDIEPELVEIARECAEIALEP